MFQHQMSMYINNPTLHLYNIIHCTSQCNAKNKNKPIFFPTTLLRFSKKWVICWTFCHLTENLYVSWEFAFCMVLDVFHFLLHSLCFPPFLSPFFYLIVPSKDLERKVKTIYKLGIKVCIGFTAYYITILFAISSWCYIWLNQGYDN